MDFRNVILIMTTNAGAADLAKAAIGFNRSKREGDDEEAINRLFTPEFRNRLDAVVAFSALPPDVITKVVEKFVFQLEAQLADRGVTIELNEEATRWLAEKGYDAKFGARPLARVIQEHIKKPLAEQLLFGSLINGGTVRIKVEGEGDEKKIGFDYFPAEPGKKPRAQLEEEQEDEDSEDQPGNSEALVGAGPKKALPGPKGEGGNGRPAGAVPSIPRRKKDD